MFRGDHNDTDYALLSITDESKMSALLSLV